jgi:hypothetical protein
MATGGAKGGAKGAKGSKAADAEKGAGVVKTTEAPGTALAPASPLLDAIRAAAGAGTENVRAEDMALPMVVLLQGMSPQTKRANPAYMEGAKEGMFLHTTTRELFDGDQGFPVIPCGFSKVWNVWRHRDEGGGFRGSFPTQELAAARAAELGTEPTEKTKGAPLHGVVETANHFYLARLSDGTWVESLHPMKSTAHKCSKAWNTEMKRTRKTSVGSFVPPSFATIYVLTSHPDHNEKGDFVVPRADYVGLLVDPDVGELLGDADSTELYNQAARFYQTVAAGAAKVDYSVLETQEAVVENDTPGASSEPGF